MTDKRIEVKTRDDKVIIDVQGQDSLMVISPQLAVQIGKSMIDAAVSLGVEVSIQAPPRMVSNTLRDHMIVRTANILRSMIGKPYLKSAPQIVDSILAMLP